MRPCLAGLVINPPATSAILLYVANPWLISFLASATGDWNRLPVPKAYPANQKKPCKPRGFVRNQRLTPTAPHRKARPVTQFQNFVALLHFRRDDRRFAGKSGPRALHFDFVFRVDLDVLVFKVPARDPDERRSFPFRSSHSREGPPLIPLAGVIRSSIGYFPGNRFHRLRIVHLVVWASLPHPPLPRHIVPCPSEHRNPLPRRLSRLP